MGENETAVIKQRETASPEEVRARQNAAIAPHRWQPGQPSPNPKGRPKDDSLPLSNALKHVLKTVIPKGHVLRVGFEKATGVKLRGRVTLGDMYCQMLAWDGLLGKFSKFSLKKFTITQQITGGREAPRAFERRQAEPAGGGQQPVDIREHILLGLLVVIKRRSEMYGLENTAMKKLEEEALEFEKKAQ